MPLAGAGPHPPAGRRRTVAASGLMPGGRAARDEDGIHETGHAPSPCGISPAACIFAICSPWCAGTEAHRPGTGVPTVEEAAAEVLAQQRPGWRNAKYGQNWPRSLRAYAFPRIGALPVSAVTTADVLAILTPIWHAKAQTAQRVRQRISAVMKWAIAMGYRPDNPAGDALGAAADRRPAHAGAAPRRGGGRPRDRASLPGLGHHQVGVRVPGADGGAIRRSAPGDVGRNGPGRGRLGHWPCPPASATPAR